MEQSSNPNGMAFLSPLGEFLRNCGSASGACSSPCGVGCEASGGFVAKLGGAGEHSTRCSDVHVEGSDSASWGRFQVGVHGSFSGAGGWVCSCDLERARAFGDFVWELV